MRALLFVRSAWRLLRSLEVAAPPPATGTARARHLQAIQQVRGPICCLTCGKMCSGTQCVPRVQYMAEASHLPARDVSVMRQQ